jgi:hypothetical protein
MGRIGRWILILWILGLMTLIVMLFARDVADASSSRTVKATYNGYLNGMVVAAPARYEVGSKLQVCHGSKCIVVRAYKGGCRCFDLSDEAFSKLAPLSVGIITVRVTQR